MAAPRPALPALCCLLALAALAPACDDGGASPSPDATAEPEPPPEPEPQPDPEPEPPRCAGLDADGDGRCDREVADWSRAATVEPGTHRGDIYRLGPALPDVELEGLAHAQVWPVTVSGILMPYDAMNRALDPEADDPTLLALRSGAAQVVGFETTEGLYRWLGLPAYDPPVAEGPFSRLPYHMAPPPGVPEGAPMGVGLIGTETVDALTFSCAACHAGRLLGRTVVGLANRQPRANTFFDLAKTLLPVISSPLLLDLIEVTDDEMALIARTLNHTENVAAREPVALGLDTSLAQVALSLSRRGDDPYAEPDVSRQVRPLPNALATEVADSKPMPWWTLKYKTRWLADGSIVSGNPVLTNFLWNEIGRGTDLHALERWMQENPRAIDALTVAVFASAPPRWTDYFPPETIDLAAAQRGQAAFEARCARCHGTYEKAWDAMDDMGPDAMDAIARLATTRVVYHAVTPVLDVGTDGRRAAGMAHFAERLNALAISRWMQTTVEEQRGYVPPPLDGIWARYPYLHNNSVPTLCALLTPPAERPTEFRQGPSEDPGTDFDEECVGYPIGDAMPDDWHAIEDSLIDTTRPGLSNQGHDEMLDGRDGNPPITADERADLVMFLKTL